jgi:single-strand DNA-binding protein
MAGLNKMTIIGNLGRDPEVRYTPDGLAVTNFSVAVTEKIRGEDKTLWFKIVAFGKLGEICGEYLSKGKQVYVDGRLQTSEWEDRDGNKRFTLEIVASTMQMLGTRADAYDGGPSSGGGGSYNKPSQPSSPAPSGGNEPSSSQEPPDDDIPF